MSNGTTPSQSGLTFCTCSLSSKVEFNAYRVLIAIFLASPSVARPPIANELALFDSGTTPIAIRIHHRYPLCHSVQWKKSNQGKKRLYLGVKGTTLSSPQENYGLEWIIAENRWCANEDHRKRVSSTFLFFLLILCLLHPDFVEIWTKNTATTTGSWHVWVHFSLVWWTTPLRPRSKCASLVMDPSKGWTYSTWSSVIEQSCTADTWNINYMRVYMQTNYCWF